MKLFYLSKLLYLYLSGDALTLKTKVFFLLDENGCKVTTVPPVADTTIWEHPSLPHALGKIFIF